MMNFRKQIARGSNEMTKLFATYSSFVGLRAKEMGSKKLNLLHAAVGCCTEAGEFLDTMKKMWVYQQDFSTLNKEGQTHEQNIIEELGDMLFYIQYACNDLGTSIEEVIQKNMDKLGKRYPDGYTDKAAMERKDKNG
jgi:NTP pyrophosphatase (non-canonical NTP hydrolase)